MFPVDPYAPITSDAASCLWIPLVYGAGIVFLYAFGWCVQRWQQRVTEHTIREWQEAQKHESRLYRDGE